MKPAHLGSLVISSLMATTMLGCNEDDFWWQAFDTSIDSTGDILDDTMPVDATDTAYDPGVDTAYDPGIDTIPDSTGTCTYTGFSPVAQEALDYSTSGFVYGGYSSTTEPLYLVSIEFFTGYGSPPPLTGPGSYTLATTAVEQNYSTCGTCVLVHQQCSTGVGCTRSFFATGGTLQISSWGDVGTQFTGSLTGVTLVEVTIDSSTFVSTPVPGGQTWCLPSYAFDATIVTGG